MCEEDLRGSFQYVHKSLKEVAPPNIQEKITEEVTAEALARVVLFLAPMLGDKLIQLQISCMIDVLKEQKIDKIQESRDNN